MKKGFFKVDDLPFSWAIANPRLFVDTCYWASLPGCLLILSWFYPLGCSVAWHIHYPNGVHGLPSHRHETVDPEVCIEGCKKFVR